MSENKEQDHGGGNANHNIILQRLGGSSLFASPAPKHLPGLGLSLSELTGLRSLPGTALTTRTIPLHNSITLGATTSAGITSESGSLLSRQKMTHHFGFLSDMEASPMARGSGSLSSHFHLGSSGSTPMGNMVQKLSSSHLSNIVTTSDSNPGTSSTNSPTTTTASSEEFSPKSDSFQRLHGQKQGQARQNQDQTRGQLISLQSSQNQTRNTNLNQNQVHSQEQEQGQDQGQSQAQSQSQWLGPKQGQSSSWQWLNQKQDRHTHTSTSTLLGSDRLPSREPNNNLNNLAVPFDITSIMYGPVDIPPP